MPFGIAITLPAIDGVISSSSKGKPASNSGLFDRVVEDMTSKDVETADGDGSSDTFSLPSEGGATHVFVDGEEKTLGILDKILKGEKPQPGSYRGRVNNEPENSRKTLMDVKNA